MLFSIHTRLVRVAPALEIGRAHEVCECLQLRKRQNLCEIPFPGECAVRRRAPCRIRRPARGPLSQGQLEGSTIAISAAATSAARGPLATTLVVPSTPAATSPQQASSGGQVRATVPGNAAAT